MKFKDYLSNKYGEKIEEAIKNSDSELCDNLFLPDISPKIKQKIELLRINPKFEKDIQSLRKKRSNLIKECDYLYSNVERLLLDTEITENDLKVISNPNKKEEKTKKTEEVKKLGNIFINKDFDKDSCDLAKKYKLYPIKWWKEVLKMHILQDFLFSPSFLFQTDSINYSKKNKNSNPEIKPDLNFSIKIRKINKVPELFVQIFENTSRDDISKNWKIIKKQQEILKDSIFKKINFDIKISEDKKTKEVELFIQIFKNTHRDDISKNWKIIKKHQEKIKKTKNIKNYYPLKNLKIANEILNRIKEEEEYYDYAMCKSEKIKETDLTIAEEIWEDISYGEEKKAMNRVKQIRKRIIKELEL